MNDLWKTKLLPAFALAVSLSWGLAAPSGAAANDGVAGLDGLAQSGSYLTIVDGPDGADAVRPEAVFASPLESEGPSGGLDYESDPWEPFNEKTFSFNRQFDRFVLKPVATVWDILLPNPVQRCVANALDNIDVVRRLTNNVLQLKFGGAGREVGRFVINSTIGVAGLFDVAKDQFGIEQSNEDTGQTFGVYGVQSGPYLVLPLLPVMTVRDGFGLLADTAMNPLTWVLPIGATAGIYGTDVVNDRSLNLETYERVEESVIDLYGAVRSAYLQRREAAIRE
jgi:phospholipid-binding lipoprotein MlaA